MMQTANFLLIQFRSQAITADMEAASIRRELGDQCVVSAKSALDTAIPWLEPAELLRTVDGVIFGGSGDYDFDGGRDHDDAVRMASHGILERLRPVLDYIFLHDIPTLGICYGHQIIGAYAGANVVHDPAQRKNRSHEVAVVVDKAGYRICADIPDSFYAHYGHKDSLDRVPDGAVLLMQGGDACKVSALCYKQNIFTTQFHPELTLDDLRLRIATVPGYLPEGVVLEEHFVSENVSNSILKNFGLFVRERSL